MLADKGHREDALVLIETLMQAVPSSGRPTGGFGQICQYYFNLRAQGLGGGNLDGARAPAVDQVHLHAALLPKDFDAATISDRLDERERTTE